MGANAAITDLWEPISTVHVLIDTDVHPDHPINLEPVAGVAVRVAVVPFA